MLKATIRLYLTLSFLASFGMSFISSNYVIFLQSNGLNLFEVNLVNLVFYATIFLCEVPTGAVADVFGRKFSYVCSCFFLSVGMWIYSLSRTFWGFALGEAVAAIGKTFATGAFQAWVVDKIHHHGYNGSLDALLEKTFSRGQQINHTGMIVGTLIGAFLAEQNMAWPWIGGGCVAAINGILALWLMKEEYFTPKKTFGERRISIYEKYCSY